MNNKKISTFTHHAYYPWLVVLLCAAFLFYKYLLQISPSVMTMQLMANFQVAGLGLGALAASYFYSYLIAQIFVGPLLDRYNPRILSSLALLIAGLGIYGFAHSHTLLNGILFRGCVGIGLAFATVNYLKMASLWFKPHQFAFVSGLLATAVMAGAVAAQVPMELLVSHTNWRFALEVCALLGVVLAVLFYLTIRIPAAAKSSDVAKQMQTLRWSDFAKILKSKNIWLLTIYSGLAFSPLAVFGGLWGNPFLEEAYGFSATTAASVSTFIFIGFGTGAPIFALLTNRFKLYTVMQLGVVLSLVSLTTVIYATHLSPFICGLLLYLFGVGVGAYMLTFTMGTSLHAIALAATVVAILNTGDGILSAFAEPFVGKLLDLQWNGTVVNGVHHFNVHAYHVAFMVLPIFLLLAVMFLFPLRKVKVKDFN